MRILVAEDEKKVCHFIRKALSEAGFAVDEAHDGDVALELALREPYGAIVLDIMMPGRDGISILKLLRNKRIATPVLILTARGEVSERVEGLQLGADDYMAKPFAMSELVARVGALVRRGSPERATLMKVGDLQMDVLSREVTRGCDRIDLTLREYTLLEFLMRSPNRVHTRTSICDHVWGYHFETGTNVVAAYIKRLRRKIDDPYPDKLLHTIRGVGYMLKASGRG